MTIHRGKVLIVDDMHHSIEPLLGEIGFESDYCPEITRSEILEKIHDYQGLMIRSKTKVDRELLGKGKKLLFVARAGAGMDKVDLACIKEKSIMLINAPEGNRDALGEHSVGLLLSVLHNLPRSYEQIKAGLWDREGNRGYELGSLTVGIFGVGHMGYSFAKKLKGFGSKVIGYDKYKFGYSDDFIMAQSFEEFCAEVEVLSIHIPLSEESRGLFTADYLKQFPKLKVIINTARGEILPLQNLVDYLKENELIGIGLDVLDNEKLGSYSATEKEALAVLQSHPNVIITPHVAGWTYESYERINKVLVAKLSESL